MATAIQNEALTSEPERPELELIRGGLAQVAIETTVEAPRFGGDPRNGTKYSVEYDEKGNIARSELVTPGVGVTRVSYHANGDPEVTTSIDYAANTLSMTFHQKEGDATAVSTYAGPGGWVSRLPKNAYPKEK